MEKNTKNDKNNKVYDFVDKELFKINRNVFIFRIIAIVAGHVGITLWLNSIRITAPLWFVWLLIIIQFTLYFSIFTESYHRAIECGLNKKIGFIIFVAFAALGRVNDWEIIIIPLIMIVMLMISARSRMKLFH